MHKLTNMEKEELKEYRKLLGLTQAQLAEKADVSREMISHYESGKYPISHTFSEFIFQLLEREGITYSVKSKKIGTQMYIIT